MTGAVVLEVHRHVGAHPDARAPAADAPLGNPAEHEALAAAELLADDQLQMEQRAVFEPRPDFIPVNEQPHNASVE